MCTKVIDDTTLRIYFPKASNVDPISQSKSTTVVSLAPENSVTNTELKDQAEETLIYKVKNLLLIFYHPVGIR